MPLLGKFGTATSRAFGFNGGGVANVPIPVPPGNVFNYDVYVNRGPTYIPGIANNVTVTIPAGTTVGSTSTGAYSLSVPSAFSPLDTVTIINNGVILGRGGNAGGAGVFPSAGGPGGVGGNAIFVARPTIITNNGVVAGGGGGGGGGGAVTVKIPGSGGGGGAGLNGGSPNGTPTAGGAGSGSGPGAGGPGGGRGAAGSGGNPGGASPGGSGGGAGSYLVGNPFVTWPVTGTRQGNVS